MKPATVKWMGEFIVIEHDDDARMFAVRPSEVFALTWQTPNVVVISLPHGMMREIYTGDARETALTIAEQCSQ